MKVITSLLILFFVTSSLSYGQENDSLFLRLRGISNAGIDFYNVDGIEIATQTQDGEFSKKNILKKFKKYPVKENDLNLSDSSINSSNFYLTKTEEISSGLIQNTSFYFIDNSNKGIIAISFTAINKRDRDLERQFVKLLLTNSIPKSVYESLQIDSVNFSGRNISLGGSCRWMGINNVQCPYYGQMNWSVHKTLEDASVSADNQYNVIKAKRQGKIISEETVDVIFEGNEVKAKKVIYDFKGVSSLLVGMSGGKTLTIYFVVGPGRLNFVSCVMSFWNNDTINPSGLPPLLEKLMKLKK